MCLNLGDVTAALIQNVVLTVMLKPLLSGSSPTKLIMTECLCLFGDGRKCSRPGGAVIGDLFCMHSVHPGTYSFALMSACYAS